MIRLCVGVASVGAVCSLRSNNIVYTRDEKNSWQKSRGYYTLVHRERLEFFFGRGASNFRYIKV